MNKEIVTFTKGFHETLKSLQKSVSGSKSVQVTNKNEKESFNNLASDWYNNLSNALNSYGISEETIKHYNSLFEKIITLSLKNSRRSSYIKQLDTINKGFAADIIVPLQTQNNILDNEFGQDVIDVLNKISDADENEYLKEALGCWKNNYLKGATVLIWCAAIDRIHRKIEEIGFDKFNSANSQMKLSNKGRFKRYNKEYNISSISELRMVFDNDILWVIEGMGLIDSNEKNRLSSCFDMRCHSGHPGAAPITKYNVISCFSDVVEIILANPKFLIS